MMIEQGEEEISTTRFADQKHLVISDAHSFAEGRESPFGHNKSSRHEKSGISLAGSGSAQTMKRIARRY